VRDAAAMAINIVKEIKGIEWEEKIEPNNYMDEDENDYNEYEDKREFMINPSSSMKNAFFKESSYYFL